MPPVVDVSQLYGLIPIGPLRDKRVVAVGNDDVVDKGGFVCQVATDGDLTYRTVGGDADQTETLEAGDAVAVGGVMVLLQAVRGSSTVTSIVVGKL